MIVFLQTIVVAAVGSLIAFYLGVPAPFLTGPASFVSIAGLLGLKMQVPDLVRNIVFIVIGLILGTSVTPETLSAAAAWPISLLAMCVTVSLIMILGAALISKTVGMDRRSALLAASPGHLSFVIGFSTDIGTDTALISVIQSMRVLILTLMVPVSIVVFTDVDLENAVVAGPLVSISHFTLLALIGTMLGYLFLKIRIPAAYLIGAMVISSIGHGSGLTPGGIPVWLNAVVFSMMGALIGTRFSGVTLKTLRRAAFAGIGVTLLGLVIVIFTALVVAQVTDLTVLSLIIALAPGGFETMAAMSSVVGADPAFVTFHHVARLFFLSVFVPFALTWKSA